MAGTPYRTVSDEMAWTDWSERPAEAPAGAPRRRWAGLAAALTVVVAMLAAAIFLLPPGIS